MCGSSHKRRDNRKMCPKICSNHFLEKINSIRLTQTKILRPNTKVKLTVCVG